MPVSHLPLVPAGVICLTCFTKTCLFELFAFLARQRIHFPVSGAGCSSDDCSSCRCCRSVATTSSGLHDWRAVRTSWGNARDVSQWPVDFKSTTKLEQNLVKTAETFKKVALNLRNIFLFGKGMRNILRDQRHGISGEIRTRNKTESYREKTEEVPWNFPWLFELPLIGCSAEGIPVRYKVWRVIFLTTHLVKIWTNAHSKNLLEKNLSFILFAGMVLRGGSCHIENWKLILLQTEVNRTKKVEQTLRISKKSSIMFIRQFLLLTNKKRMTSVHKFAFEF